MYFTMRDAFRVVLRQKASCERERGDIYRCDLGELGEERAANRRRGERGGGGEPRARVRRKR